MVSSPLGLPLLSFGELTLLGRRSMVRLVGMAPHPKANWA